MDSFFARYKNPLVLIGILLAQTILLAVQVRRPEDPHNTKDHVRLVRLWASTAVWPLERMVHGTRIHIRGMWDGYIDLRHIRQQNRDLQQEVARLRIEQVGIAADAEQGHRLQALLQFQQQYIAKTVAAQIIGSSGSDQSRMLTIDKGWKDGLKPDLPVITPDGVVGKLRDVFPYTSQVLELNDMSSGAGVMLESSGIRAVLRGTPTGGMQIANQTADARIHPGDRVLTSGGDRVYPRGLTVGTIESIRPDPEHQPYAAIAVTSAAKLNQLEEVLVITGTQSTMPGQMQQDLSGAAADAARAATAAAERLPELQTTTDPNAPLTTPRPVPALHPDRFTPGATPPAATLTPGGAAPAGPVAVQQPAERTQRSNATQQSTEGGAAAEPQNGTAP